MSPRNYDMSRRAAAVEETRRRIVQATMDLHLEKGIVETTLPDIAQRADVALGTVYRHFPTVSDVVKACGDAWAEQDPPPGPDEIAAAFAGARSKRERAERLAHALAEFYRGRLQIVLEVRRSRHAFRYIEQGHREIEALLDAFVEEALRPLKVSDGARRAVRGLIDPRAWEALLERVGDEHEVERLVARFVASVI